MVKTKNRNALKKEKSLKRRKKNRASLHEDILGSKIVKPKIKKNLIRRNVKNNKEEELITDDENEIKGDFKNMKVKEKLKIINLSKKERAQFKDNDDISEEEYETLLKSMNDLNTITEETKSETMYFKLIYLIYIILK